MVPREIKDNGYAIFFLVVELRGGGGGVGQTRFIMVCPVLFYHLLCLVNDTNRPSVFGKSQMI